MFTVKPNMLSVLLLAPLTNAMAAIQPEVGANDLKLSLQATTEYTDNAKKVEEDKLSERQEKYDLGIAGRYSNDWLLFTTAYDANRRSYSEQSQPDYNYLEGNSHLTLGNPSQLASLAVTHSRRSLLSTPDALDLSQNRDQRDIVMAEPALHWRMTSADTLLLKGDFARTSYRVDSGKNSKLDGGELVWIRDISKVDELQLRLQDSRATFDSFSGANYEYQTVSASYGAKLNHFSYVIQAGSNRAKPENSTDTFTRPSYSIESNYASLLNSVKISVSQTITNSAYGDGNHTDISNFGQGTKNVGLDLINQRIAQIALVNTGLCDVCTANLALSYRSDDYRVLVEDSVDKAITAGFDYKLSRHASIDTTASRHEKDFVTGSRYGSYTSNQFMFGFTYTLFEQLRIRLYEQEERRNSSAVNGQRYDEHRVGFGLSYQF